MKPKLAESVEPNEIVTISEKATVEACHAFAKDYHLLVGGSTGSVLAVIKQKAHAFAQCDTVVAISPDLGEKYLDTIYDPAWVDDNIHHSSKIAVSA